MIGTRHATSFKQRNKMKYNIIVVPCRGGLDGLDEERTPSSGKSASARRRWQYRPLRPRRERPSDRRRTLDPSPWISQLYHSDGCKGTIVRAAAGLAALHQSSRRSAPHSPLRYHRNRKRQLAASKAAPTITSQPALAPSPQPRPAPTARALPPGLAA
jgi:hypothetical protein